jgi:hypothetical protein
MAIQTILGGAMLPPIRTSQDSIALNHIGTISAADAAVAVVCQAPKTGNIRKVVWGTRTVTTGATCDLRIETIDASTGHPSGSLWAANTNGSVVIVDTDDNAVFTTTLTADAAVTMGDTLAVRLNNPNTSFGNMQVFTIWNLQSSAQSMLPYIRFFNGTSWAAVNIGFPMLMFEYDDGSYAPIAGCYPVAASITTHTLSTSTTPDVAGARFRLPFPCRIRGAWVGMNATGDCKVMLVSTGYNQGAGTGILATATIDKDIRRNSAGIGPHIVEFAAPYELAANTYARLVVEPTTTTSLGGVYDVALASAAQLDSWFIGQDWHLTTAKDPTADGDWTNYNLGTFRTPLQLGLWIDGFGDDTGVGGSGGVSRARVQRGM